MNENIATEPAELVRQLLHLLKLPGDQSITIDVIEQAVCSKCKKNVSNMSEKNHIEVNTISKSSLTIWLKNIKPIFDQYCCRKRIPTKDVSCSAVSLPNILIVYSHGGLNGKIVETGGFYNTEKVSGYKKIKEYHAVAAVCGSKVIVLGSNTHHVLEVGKNVQSTSDESCIGPNATVIFKAIYEFDNDSLNMKVKYISIQLEKSNVDESTISDIKNELEIYIDDLLDEVNSELKREDVLMAIQGLKFETSIFKNVLVSISKQYGYHCCVLEFGSADQTT